MKKLMYLIVLGGSLLIIQSLVHSIYTLWQKQSLVDKARKELALEQNKNKSLKNRLRTLEKEEFVEEEARNKLFLVKPGESVVILPQNTSTVAASKKSSQPSLPHWQKWLKLFF